LTKISIGIYTHSLLISILSIGSRTKPVRRKTLVCNFWSVGEFVGNKLTDGFRDRQSAQKNWYISFQLYFPQEVCHINNRNTTCNFIGVFICLSVYPSVNITYHQWNIIYNSIRDLTVLVIFATILFQHSEIYRRTWHYKVMLCKVHYIVQINQNYLLLCQLTCPYLHLNFLRWFCHYHHLDWLVCVHWTSKHHSTPQRQHQHQQKYYRRHENFNFLLKTLDNATQYRSTKSPSWKTLSSTINSLFPSWTTLTRPLSLVFTTDNQSTLECFFLN
jgi:hypothetical protein